MGEDLTGAVHIGVNADISFFVEIDGENLKDAVEYLENSQTHENLEEIISLENFTSVVDKVHDVSLFQEDKTEPITFYDSKNGAGIFGRRISGGLSTLIWLAFGAATGAAIGLSPLTEYEYAILLLSFIIPGMLFATGKLLEGNRLPIWGFPSAIPENLANTVGTYKLQVVGTGFLQMFIEEKDEELGKKMALAIFSLGPSVSSEPVPLMHFISLSTLKGIYLIKEGTEERISDNLVPLTKRLFKYSSLKYQLIGGSLGAAGIGIPLALINLFS